MIRSYIVAMRNARESREVGAVRDNEHLVEAPENEADRREELAEASRWIDSTPWGYGEAIDFAE